MLYIDLSFVVNVVHLTFTYTDLEKTFSYMRSCNSLVSKQFIYNTMLTQVRALHLSYKQKGV